MKFRSIIFWSHLAVGVATGIVVFLLAITGVLLTYEVQLTRLAEAKVEVVGARLDVGALADAALLETDGQATALVFENDATAPVAATFGRGGKVLLDPYTGAALEGGDSLVAKAMGATTSFHRWLSVTGFSGTGKAITGVANLGFFFLALSGAYLWLPKIWRWTMFRVRMFFRAYPNAQARDFHWHHVFAFWSLIPLIVIIGTGVTMSFDRAQGLVMVLAGASGEEGPRRPGRAPDDAVGLPESVDLDAVLAVAMAHDPAWKRVTLNLAAAPETGEMTALVDTGPGRRMPRQETVTIATDEPKVAVVTAFADQPKAVRTFMFLRFAHTGEHYGFVGQTIAGLASLASAFMVYTGLALAWRRLISPLLRRRRSA